MDMPADLSIEQATNEVFESIAGLNVVTFLNFHKLSVGIFAIHAGKFTEYGGAVSTNPDLYRSFDVH